MGQKTPEVPEYLEFLEYLISCFLGLCSLGYLAFVSWLPVFPVLPYHLQKCLHTGTVVPADFWRARESSCLSEVALMAHRHRRNLYITWYA